MLTARKTTRSEPNARDNGTLKISIESSVFFAFEGGESSVCRLREPSH